MKVSIIFMTIFAFGLSAIAKASYDEFNKSRFSIFEVLTITEAEDGNKEAIDFTVGFAVSKDIYPTREDLVDFRSESSIEDYKKIPFTDMVLSGIEPKKTYEDNQLCVQSLEVTEHGQIKQVKLIANLGKDSTKKLNRIAVEYEEETSTEYTAELTIIRVPGIDMDYEKPQYVAHKALFAKIDGKKVIIVGGKETSSPFMYGNHKIGIELLQDPDLQCSKAK